MKRSPLKRGKSLTRKTPLRGKRSASKYRSRPRDLSYMAWIRRQSCVLVLTGECDGHVEADHAGLRPVGRKADDRTCIPLCRKHHTQRGSFSGMFRSWNKDTMRLWLATAVVFYQLLYDKMRGV